LNHASSAATTTMHVASVNDAPVLDLDANDSSGATLANYTTKFTEDGAAVALADADVTITDVDNTLLKSATITITNFQAGQDVLAFTPNANTGDIAVGTNASGVLTLTSAAGATLAAWQAALKATTYANTSQNPVTTDRTITIVVDDNQSANHASNTATATVHVVAVNDAPVLDLDANNSSTTGNNYITTFTEDGAAVALADADVAISDVDNTLLKSATITITN